MKERSSVPGKTPLYNRTRHYREHPYAGQPLLRRVIAWRGYSGFEKRFKAREPIQIKKVA